MLKPDKNRLDYGELLSPPSGYGLERAIGTTYTLNLETLLGVPFALAMQGSAGEENHNQDIMLLDIIRKNAAKLHIFCEVGRISVPRENRKVLSLLEDSITQVKPTAGKTFHPKVWVVKYYPDSQKEVPLYRVLVLSRNLTFDRSWDLAVMLEGRQTDSTAAVNEPLSSFLKYLSRHQERKKHRDVVKQISEEVRYVDFKAQLPGKKYFRGFEFFPMGINEGKQPESLHDESFHELVIISPFLTDSVIKNFKDKGLSGSQPALISRPQSMQSLNRDTLEDVECWCLKDVLVEGESMLEEEGLERSKQELHAKLYLKNKASHSELWVGSANCTHSAFNGNVEFLLKLNCYRYEYNKEILLKDLMGEDKETPENPFERWHWEEKQSEVEVKERQEMERLAAQIARSKTKARAAAMEDTGKGDRKYQLEVFLTKKYEIPEDMEVKIAPLMRPGLAKPIVENMVFTGIYLSDISMFYKVTIKHKRVEEIEAVDFVLKIWTAGIPQERDAAIFRSVIRNREGFFQYVALILGEDMALTLAELLNMEGKVGWKRKHVHEYRPVLYEKMLKAAAQSPEKFNQLREIMETLSTAVTDASDDIVPEDFRELYRVFERTLGRKSR